MDLQTNINFNLFESMNKKCEITTNLNGFILRDTRDICVTTNHMLLILITYQIIDSLPRK